MCFRDSLITAAEAAIPKTKPSSKRKLRGVPYWTSKCASAVRKREQALAASRSNKTADAYINYKKQKAICRRVIKDTKQEYWESYCDTLTDTTKLTSVWRMAKSMQGSSSPASIPTLVEGGITCKTNAEKAELFASKFSSYSARNNQTQEFIKKSTFLEQTWAKPSKDAESQPCILDHDIEYHELASAIKQCKRGSAPGADHISYEMIQHLSKSSLLTLLDIYNEIWKTGALIPEWKHSIIIPIKKPNNSAHDANSYRPIALTACLCKVMERIITNRMLWYLDSNHLLNDIQAGFRSNRSTLDQLLRLHTDAFNSIKAKKYTVAILLDFTKAFDLIWHEGLLHKMRKLGLTGRAYKWVLDFLTNRTIQVRIGADLSSVKNMEMGTPQGSVISPLLFLIMIADFPESSTLQTSLFADDSSVWKSGGSLKHIQLELQTHLNKICQWCTDWGFVINSKKTVCIIFTRKRKFNQPQDLQINGSSVEYVKEAKFLGMIFDANLTWNKHATYIKSRIKVRINLMRMVSGLNWGAGKRPLVAIYRALVRSVIEYGLELYSSASKSTIKILESIQAQCLRICCGALKSTPIIALQNECGEAPIVLKKTEILMRHAARIISNPNNPTKDSLTDTWHSYIPRFYGTSVSHQIMPIQPTLDNLVKKNPSPTPPWNHIALQIDTDLSKAIQKKSQNDLVIKQLALCHMTKYHQYTAIYTDGSKEQEKTACAFVTADQATTYRLPDDSDIIEAELQAIEMACKYLTIQAEIKKAVIYTDSITALDLLISIKQHDYKVYTDPIQTTYHGLQLNGTDVVLVWVPSHVGIPGNEAADHHAKLGRSLPLNNTKKGERTIKYCNKKTHEWMIEAWQYQYDKQPKALHYKQIEPKVSSEIKYTSNHRRTEVIITRLIDFRFR